MSIEFYKGIIPLECLVLKIFTRVCLKDLKKKMFKRMLLSNMICSIFQLLFKWKSTVNNTQYIVSRIKDDLKRISIVKSIDNWDSYFTMYFKENVLSREIVSPLSI